MEWKKGDKVRNKITGKVVEVESYKPRYSKSGAEYADYERGFLGTTGWWDYLDEYGLIERAQVLKPGTKVKTKYSGEVFTIKRRDAENDDNYAKGKAYKTEEGCGYLNDSQFDVIGQTEKRRAKKGEKILIVNETMTNGEYSNGDILTVTGPHGDGDVDVKGVHMFISEEEYEVIIEEDDNMSKYNTVKRKARVGERILITDAGYTGGQYTNGDVLTVRESDDVVVLVEEASINIEHEEYEVIIEEKTCETIKMTLPDGTVLEGKADELAKLGDLNKETKKCSLRTIEHKGGTFVEVDRRAQVGDVVEYGDGKVKLVTGKNSDGNLGAEDGCDGRRDCKSDSGRCACWNVYGAMKPVRVYEPSDEAAKELTAVKLKQGDLAIVEHSPCASPEGSIVEIVSTNGDSLCARGVRGGGGDITEYMYAPRHLKLIASAESRVDNDA